MVLCRGSSVCNFHSGPGNFDFSGVSPWNFNFVIFWKQTLAFTCLGTRFPSNHLVFFSIFPLLKAYVRMLNNYHKRTSTPVFFSEPLRFWLFSFVFLCFTQLVPQISPQTKPSQVASNQSIHERYGSCNRSINNWQRSISPTTTSQRREDGNLHSLDLSDPSHAPRLPPIKNHPGKYGRIKGGLLY